MDKSNRMTAKQYQEQIASGQVANYSPRAWESKLQALLREAVAAYGHPRAAHGKEKQEAPPDAGYWRDVDKSNPRDNKRRMPGHLDFVYWRVWRYQDLTKKAEPFLQTLPRWKRSTFTGLLTGYHQRAESEVAFDLHIECKTGGGVPNQEQLRTIRRVNLNPGSHAIVVYPHDLPYIRAILGI